MLGSCKWQISDEFKKPSSGTSLLLLHNLIIFRGTVFASLANPVAADDGPAADQDPQLLAEVEPNLEERFIEVENFDEEANEFDRNESELTFWFYRQKIISCFVHNLMTAVKKVKVFIWCSFLKNCIIFFLGCR